MVMTELQNFVAMLERAGGTYTQTPDLHGTTCVSEQLSEGYDKIDRFFDAAGKMTRAVKQSLATATPPDWKEITPNTCGGGP